MTYSCGIYPSLDSDIFPGSARHSHHPWMETDELERSQYAKLHHIIRKAKIGQGHRVLEIGSGWGSFAIEAVRTTGCTVDTLTLSEQQKSLAEERIKLAGLQDKITVHLLDFRSIPKEWYHTFDRLVSIEMLEAVGKEYIKPYFEMIDNVLNDQGVACFQVITIPEARFATCELSEQ
jgi:cyclopropane-fatty-acyl-phospholipid synthase